MANGPSREERRAYANAGKDQYYDNQENVLFPQAQADIWQQVGQRGQALDEWSFQQQQAKEDYKNQVKYQTDSYKNQILAFEKSDEIYQKNQKYIQGAYDSKVAEADAQLSETVQAGYFNLDAAQRQFGLQQQKSQNEINRYDLNIDKLNLQKGLYNKQIQSGQKQFDAKKAYIGKQQEFNQKRFDNTKADITQQRLRNQTGFEQQRDVLDKQLANNQASYLSQDSLYQNQLDANVTNYDNQIAYLDKTIEDVNTRKDNDIDQATLNRNINEANRKQTLAELKAQKTYIQSQLTTALEEKNSRDSQIDLGYQEKVSSGMYEQLANKVQSIVDQGAVSSRGSRGRSVATTLNNTVAAAGFNGARLTEGLLRAGRQRDIQKAESTTGYTKQLAGITQEQTTNTLRINREEARGGEEGEIESQFTLSKALIEDNATAQKRGITNNKTQETASKQETEWNLNNAKTQGTIQRDDRADSLKFNKDSNLLNKQRTSDQLNASMKSAKLDRKTNKRSLKYDLKSSRLTKKANEDSLKSNKSQTNKDISDVQQRQNLIAAELGFTAEQLDMTAEQLGESILSASEANTRTKQNLKRMAEQENQSAFYQRMARPKFTALPKPPYEVEMPKFAPVVKMASPGEFLSASDSGYLNATRPASGPSGISKALSIGGMVLGAVAAPFTAGASLAGTGALMSAGTAAGLSAGGTLLGGLGKSGLFD